jgi:hypothetical protein
MEEHRAWNKGVMLSSSQGLKALNACVHIPMAGKATMMASKLRKDCLPAIKAAVTYQNAIVAFKDGLIRH